MTKIRTWWERLDWTNKELATKALVRAMKEEIAELRAALSQQQNIAPVAWFERAVSGEWFLAYSYNPNAPETRPLIYGPAFNAREPLTGVDGTDIAGHGSRPKESTARAAGDVSGAEDLGPPTATQ